MRDQAIKVSVVVPCFRVKSSIVKVIEETLPYVTKKIYIIDDCCPEKSGFTIQDFYRYNESVRLIFLSKNQGVGGATIAGIQQAIADGADIIVKIDGDGQMDPALIPTFVEPIIRGEADYTKGNRFFSLENLKGMPTTRLIGNAGLSFFAKLSTGYWDIYDPTNGFVAIHTKVAKLIPWHKVHKRFFFESDLLFRLGTLRAKVVDIPMQSIYGDETSNLNPWRELPKFFYFHTSNMVKRIFYCYYLRDFNIASLELLLGLPLLIFGTIFGIIKWGVDSPPATSGTVMLAALPFIIGFQLLLSFLNFDISQSSSVQVLHKKLSNLNR